MSASADKDKSDRILAAVRERKKEQVVDVDEEKFKLVIFTLRGDHYAFHGNDIKEILTYEEPNYVPGAPDYIYGIINVRGDIESVINIHKFMGMPDTEPTGQSRIAIAAKDDIRSGILVDTVEDVVDVPASSIKPPISTLNESLREFVTGELDYNSRNITLLDVGNIFSRIAV
jgi:purine-binding chemotaxis protein CheW